MQRRMKLMALLGLVAIFGFGAEFAHARAQARSEAFERHLAQLCVDAARSGQLPPPAPSRGW